MSRMMLPHGFDFATQNLGRNGRMEIENGKLKTEKGGTKMKEDWKECKCTFRMERRNLK